MWLWIILTVISLGNLSLATSDVSNEFAPDEATGDESLFLQMDERSYPLKTRRSDLEDEKKKELDARFGFLRLGRRDYYFPTKDFYDFEDEDTDEFSRSTRSHNKNDNFIRFGRGQSDFMRFGRDPYKYVSRISRGLNKDKNFIRFGRNAPVKRSRRDVYSTDYNQQKRNYNRDMLRFGRRDNFLRFGRLPADKSEINAHFNSLTKNVSNENKEKNIHPFLPFMYHDSSLLPVLTEIALKMRNDDKDTF